MLPKDIPYAFMFLKKASKGNPTFILNSKKVFFAFTSKAVEDVVLNKYSSFKKEGGFKRLKYVLGEGLITSEEPRHMNNKKEISPSFSHSHIKHYETKVSEILDPILSGWSGEVNVRTDMGFFVFKTTMEIFFSENLDNDFAKIREHIALVSDKVAFGTYDDELDKSTRYLKDLTRGIVDKRLESNENKNDFLSILINSYKNKKIDSDDLYDEALTILLTSYETTAYVLEWAVYYLSINKKWQEKISKEEDVDAFINEVLRMCPAIWNAKRIATEDVNIDGTDLTAGTEVMVCSLAVHRDKDVFEDPDMFKPERWFENRELSKGEYFPFLFGKRQCIGKDLAWMEITMVLVKIAKKFNIELINKEVSDFGGLSYRIKDPIMLNVTNK
jgi:cytochrome P450